MLYALPVFGWFFGLLFHISLAVPFYICWNALAPKFFYWLPPVYQHLGFWETVGLFVVISILKWVFVPRLAHVESKSGGGGK
jgi:hypothetical protein